MRATHAGKRTSAKRTLSPEARARAAENLALAREMKAQSKAQGNGSLHPEEDPRFPGFHTCVVPKINPQNPNLASPVFKYEGEGYRNLSEDPKHSGNSGEVVMGLPIGEFLKREEARMAYHNGLMANLMPGDMDIPEKPGQDVPVFFDRGASGLRTGDPISLAEAGASIGNSKIPALPVAGD